MGLTIRERIDKIYYEIDKEEKIFKTKVKELEKKLREIQNTCPHNNTKYWPDPSGNNGSWYECEDCGKEV